ncbi:MAG: hypothetical protein ACRC5Q_05775 [Culicoidibacterales bacterium]
MQLTHKQIVKHFRSMRKVISRILKCFEKEGYVEVKRSKIEIIALL